MQKRSGPLFSRVRCCAGLWQLLRNEELVLEDLTPDGGASFRRDFEGTLVGVQQLILDAAMQGGQRMIGNERIDVMIEYGF